MVEKDCIKYKIEPSSLRISYGKHEVLGLINPQDFIDLALKTDFDNEQIWNNVDKLTSTEWHKKQIEENKELPIPMLWMDNEGGYIVGHEGRHRAKACVDLGIESMPVIIRIDNFIPFKNEYDQIDYDLLNKLTSKGRSMDQMFQEIGEAQKTKLEPVPKFCTIIRNKMFCNLRSEPEYRSDTKFPAKRIEIQIADFDPFCNNNNTIKDEYKENSD